MPTADKPGRRATDIDVSEAPPELGPQGPAAEKPDYRPALDGLRALAVSAVIAYHLGYVSGGFLGVDLFFVLSGYLITGLLVSEFSRTAQISVLRFWARRVRRLYPALIPVIVAVLIYGTTVDPTARSDLRGDVISSLFYFANWHFAAGAQSYFAQFTAPSPLRHFWSLAIEEQFYVVWPVVVATCMWLNRRRAWLLVIVAVLGAAGSSLLLASLWNAADPSAAYYSTLARAHELLIGALLALILRRRVGTGSAPSSTMALGGATAVGIIVAFGFADNGSAYYHGGSVVFCLAVAGLIAGVERLGPNPVRDLFSLRPVRYVGRISYALYLWHWPVILWVTSTNTGLSGVALNLFRIAVMTIAAAASTHLLEEPIRRGRLGALVTPLRIGYGLATVSILMIALTFAMTQAGPSASSQTLPAKPPRDLRATASSEGRSVAAIRPVPSAPKPAVAVFGDSVPETLKPSLDAAAANYGVRLVDAAVGGCGVVSMTQTDATGNVVSWQETCDSTADHEREVVKQVKPQAVIWYSGTENEPMLVDGSFHPPGTPQHKRALREAMVAAHARLTADGARLYLVKVPPHGPPPGGCADPEANPQCAINSTFNSTVPYVNAQLQWLARRYDDTSLISLDPLICPDGAPCPTTLHGEAVRPDGTHISDALAPRLASALMGRIVAPPSTTTGEATSG